MARWILLSCLFLALPSLAAPKVVVASKKFTESVVLGEIVTRLIRSKGVATEHKGELGGTQILWKGLLRGDIDAYVEYTGTLRREMFSDRRLPTEESLIEALKEKGVLVGPPFGFNNTYAISMLRDRAKALGITRISDLPRFPDLAMGFTQEFMERNDGWPALRELYQLPHQDVRGMDHDISYRGVATGELDVIDTYATDAEIQYYDLVALEDDKELFPRYDALVIYREDLSGKVPGLKELFAQLGGTIDEEQMSKLNARVRLDKKSEGRVAADFLKEEFGIQSMVDEESLWERLWKATLGHLYLVIVSMSLTLAAALPLGIIAARTEKLGQLILGVTGILQTIPSLALLVLMIPLLGIGTAPAIAALFLYALLPIVRNTYTGLHDIPHTLIESADALGLSKSARLWKVELPLAARAILAGVKTSLVINIGTATLGALIGAGGYGEAILTGIRLDDFATIMEGALPAAGLAIVAQILFEFFERLVVPKGLRIRPEVG